MKKAIMQFIVLVILVTGSVVAVVAFLNNQSRHLNKEHLELPCDCSDILNISGQVVSVSTENISAPDPDDYILFKISNRESIYSICQIINGITKAEELYDHQVAASIHVVCNNGNDLHFIVGIPGQITLDYDDQHTGPRAYSVDAQRLIDTIQHLNEE